MISAVSLRLLYLVFQHVLGLLMLAGRASSSPPALCPARIGVVTAPFDAGRLQVVFRTTPVFGIRPRLSEVPDGAHPPPGRCQLCSKV